MIRNIKLIWFFVVSFTVIIWNILIGHDWHVLYCDFHVGDDERGLPLRKQLIAKRTATGCKLYWQDLSCLKGHNTSP